MANKIITFLIALIYVLALPILIAFHVHAFSAVDGEPSLKEYEDWKTSSNPFSPRSSTCQICSRLPSVGVIQIEQGFCDPDLFATSVYLLETNSPFFPIHRGIQLRAPPATLFIKLSIV